MKKFRCVSRDISLTYSQCELETKSWLFDYLKGSFSNKLSYLLIAEEKHEDGGKHFHVQMQFVQACNLTSFQKVTIPLGRHPHIEKTKYSAKWNEYCLKEDQSPLIFGEYEDIYKSPGPKETPEEKRQRKTDLIMNSDLATLVMNGEVAIEHYLLLQKTKRAIELDINPVPKCIKRECIWIQGPPGCGKTYWATLAYESLYRKPQNKWWDGYNQEETVLIDDFDCKELGHHMKIWADDYAFTAECKGSSIKPVYTRLIVTSNYFPEDLWSNDPMMAQAVRRRFTFASVEGSFPEFKLIK